MTASATFRQIVQIDGLTLRAGQLREAGFELGDGLAVEVRRGRITLVKPDSAYAKAMEALDFCTRRYDATLRRLAR